TGHGVAGGQTLAVSRFAEGIHVLLLQALGCAGGGLRRFGGIVSLYRLWIRLDLNWLSRIWLVRNGVSGFFL
ncbi:hypothetical protein OA77_30945, partial [Pseudomonas coronafaciens]